MMEPGAKLIRTAALMMITALGACGGGGSSSTPAPTSSVTPATTSQSATHVKLSGAVTYDHVPHKAQGYGLDYNAIVKSPARGVVVALLDDKDNVIQTTSTNAQGRYSFDVGLNTSVKVQVQAKLLASDKQAWDVSTTDNTLDNALYAMEGSLKSSGSQSSQTRDLHAGSGWNNGAYTGDRVAAPFAILDPIYEAITSVTAIDPDAVMPKLEIRWSADNAPVIGDKSKGQIGTSGFHKDDNVIYLLGAEGRDTDEYDPHVIIHEWGHYFEHNLARMDSLGGLHSLGDKLDPRVAFSEGFGNALSAIITGDPEYKDSSGEGQDGGFVIDFEDMSPVRAGWFNEGSVAAIIYDVHDDNSDGSDHMSLGFAPIYQALTDDTFKNSSVFTTIYTFSESLLKQSSVNNADYEMLLSGQKIASSDGKGAGENNSGSIASALPVYKEVRLGEDPVQICSVDDAGNYNKLGNREFVLLDLETDGNYMISVKRKSGEEQRDPDFNIWKGAELVQEVSSSLRDEEIFRGSLRAGNYVIEAYDFYNINGGSTKRGDACYALTVLKE